MKGKRTIREAFNKSLERMRKIDVDKFFLFCFLTLFSMSIFSALVSLVSARYTWEVWFSITMLLVSTGGASIAFMRARRFKTKEEKDN